MLEFPEVKTISSQLDKELAGKSVTAVLPPNKPHKFCWFNGEPDTYEARIKNSKIESVKGFGIYVEINFDNGKKLCFNDGVNARIIYDSKLPKTYQLLIYLSDNIILAFSVAMYGGIILHDGDYDNSYYLKSISAISPFSDEFESYYFKIFSESKPNLSVKAFLATEQRFPGIGNGVLQDILFQARIHPKRKLSSLSDPEKRNLMESVVAVLKEMTELGGRDTEKNIYGQSCGYKTKMSKKTVSLGCPICKHEIVKETYLGGAVYYCPSCQSLNK